MLVFFFQFCHYLFHLLFSLFLHIQCSSPFSSSCFFFFLCFFFCFYYFVWLFLLFILFSCYDIQFLELYKVCIKPVNSCVSKANDYTCISDGFIRRLISNSQQNYCIQICVFNIGLVLVAYICDLISDQFWQPSFSPRSIFSENYKCYHKCLILLYYT